MSLQRVRYAQRSCAGLTRRNCYVLEMIYLMTIVVPSGKKYVLVVRMKYETINDFA